MMDARRKLTVALRLNFRKIKGKNSLDSPNIL